MIHHDRRSDTDTERVPTCKLEVFRVLPSIIVTYRTRTMIRWRTFHLYPGHEVHILPTFIIGCSESLVCLRRCQAKSVLIGRTVNALPRMIIFHRLRWNQFTARIPHATETTVGFIQQLPYILADQRSWTAGRQPGRKVILQVLHSPVRYIPDTGGYGFAKFILTLQQGIQRICTSGKHLILQRTGYGHILDIASYQLIGFLVA